MTMARTAHLDRFAQDNLPPRAEWPRFVFERPGCQEQSR
jgi:2-aminobenzoate-CoA ligase